MPQGQGPRFIPITPKRRVMPKVSIAGVGVVLVKFAVAVIGRQTLYPPKPARIKRRRTGDYGRRWTMKGPQAFKAGLMIQAGSNLEYAARVGGLKKGPKKYRQSKAMPPIGWTSVEEVGQDEWKKTRPAVIKALH